MKLHLLIALTLLFPLKAVEINGFNYSEAEISETLAALEDWRKFALDSKINPTTEDIPKLGLGLRKTSSSSIYVTGDRIGVHKEIQSSLLAIPGHAQYYADRVNNLRKQFDEQSPDGLINDMEKTRLRHALLNEQMFAFQTLQQLPSPETVRVLGEFLTDERGRLMLPDEENNIIALQNWQQRSNSVYAAQSLAALPLKNKPHAPPSYHDHNQDPKEWINWYTQIKEGRRTFSFEGDPTEYDLNGPAPKALNPDLPRVNRRDQSADGAANDETQRSSGKSSSLPWIVGIAAAVLVFGGWLAVRKSQAV